MEMSNQLRSVKLGLALVMLGIAFNVAMGVSFAVNEDLFQSYIQQGIQAHPGLLDEKSAGHIWRFAQRAHFHAGGISAFSLGLIILVALSGMKASMQQAAATLIGLSGLYPLSWFEMFLLAPAIGVPAAHHHFLTEAFTYVGIGGLVLGSMILAANLFLGLFAERAP
jgi:hypothetical protein